MPVPGPPAPSPGVPSSRIATSAEPSPPWSTETVSRESPAAWRSAFVTPSRQTRKARPAWEGSSGRTPVSVRAAVTPAARTDPRRAAISSQRCRSAGFSVGAEPGRADGAAVLLASPASARTARRVSASPERASSLMLAMARSSCSSPVAPASPSESATMAVRSCPTESCSSAAMRLLASARSRSASARAAASASRRRCKRKRESSAAPSTSMSGHPMPASDIASEGEGDAEAPANPSTTAESATVATAATPPAAASRRGARATQA